MRDKIEEFYKGGSQAQSLEEHVFQCFEGASRVLTKHLLHAVHGRRDFQEWYAAAVRQHISSTIPAADDHEAESEALPEDKPFVKGNSAKSGLTEDMLHRGLSNRD